MAQKPDLPTPIPCYFCDKAALALQKDRLMRALPRLLAALPFALLPFASLAAGGNDSAPPKPTETTTKCKKGEIFDAKLKACVAPDKTGLSDDTRFDAVRELAYADRPEEALAVLATMTEGNTDRVLTYKGFASRKAGRVEEGLAFYAQALAQNPDNVLARSYLGQAYVTLNELDLARAELVEIAARGGTGTWAHGALASAILTGTTSNY